MQTKPQLQQFQLVRNVQARQFFLERSTEQMFDRRRYQL
jgi:hypothetical protein